MPEQKTRLLAFVALLLAVVVAQHPVVADYLHHREDRSHIQAEWRKLIPQRRDALFNDPDAPIAGNPNGDVSLVEFLDYNCVHCRAGDVVLQQVLKNDPKLKVVYKEHPGEAPGSKFAATAALASRKQGLFEPFHHALLATHGQLSESSVLTIARKVGLDVEKLKQDMQDPAIEDALKRNRALAEELSITGTPGLVLGDEVIVGVPEIPELARLIAKAREKPSHAGITNFGISAG
ncbi:DsbA family protein [Mesorhizobium carmichaelinearum]|uniref:DsbA family protein n=1 Tax=Mesorhizobium carmichaelinearum TaxID=1208188 RepID=UPI000BA4D38A|nr:DsbA family protein [Mesorhizobium carmichaelinearum]